MAPYPKPSAERVWIIISEKRNPLGGIDHLVNSVWTDERAAMARLRSIDRNYNGNYQHTFAYDILEVKVSQHP